MTDRAGQWSRRIAHIVTALHIQPEPHPATLNYKEASLPEQQAPAPRNTQAAPPPLSLLPEPQAGLSPQQPRKPQN
jgi:hypothetical protein